MKTRSIFFNTIYNTQIHFPASSCIRIGYIMSPRRKNVAVPRRNTPHRTAVCGVISPANEPFSGQKTGYCNRWDSLFACFPAKWGPNFGYQFSEAAPLNNNETALPPPELALYHSHPTGNNRHGVTNGKSISTNIFR